MLMSALVRLALVLFFSVQTRKAVAGSISWLIVTTITRTIRLYFVRTTSGGSWKESKRACERVRRRCTRTKKGPVYALQSRSRRMYVSPASCGSVSTSVEKLSFDALLRCSALFSGSFSLPPQLDVYHRTFSALPRTS